ncbi:unnamed protein product [Agarophyton chilense]
MTDSFFLVLFIFIVTSHSQPLQLLPSHDKFSLKRGQPQRKYRDDTDILMGLPKQPDRAARIELSLILENLELNETVNDILIRCMSSNTGTNETSWGAYRVDRFTPSQVQVQYFCIVSETQSLLFPEVVDSYINSGNLLRCLQEAREDIPRGVDIISGRTVAAPRSGSIVSAAGSTPGWAAGVALGVVAAIGGVALIAVLLKGEDVYLEAEYADFESDFQDEQDLESCSDRMAMTVKDHDGRASKEVPGNNGVGRKSNDIDGQSEDEGE